MTTTPKTCACADCGHEQTTMDPCESCGSIRTVLISVLVECFGANWRDAFRSVPGPETDV